MPAADVKPSWLSKTLWVNFVLALGALFAPGVSEWVSTHGELVAVGFAVINGALRAITKDKLVLY